jgi:putative two-component system response regulator
MQHLEAPTAAAARQSSPEPACPAGTDPRLVGPLAAEARVLVVDDDAQQTRLLERQLRQAGYAHVHATTDATAVAEVCATYQPDVILLDLAMPARDGFDVLADLAGAGAPTADVPVLMLTGQSDVASRNRALLLGAKDFVAKPFEVTEILLRVRNLLETRRLHRTLAEHNALLEHRVAERTRALEDAQMEVLERLAAAGELRDDDTGEHTQRVGEIAAHLARRLGLPERRIALIRQAAALHDVGKIGIPDAILRKPGRLTPSESEAMRAHTLLGARILRGGRSAAVRLAEQIARSHHERWDGSGYPEGLAGAQIPLEARIVSVADVLDALSHARPYRDAWPPEQVAALIRDGRGTHFDPAVVDALLGIPESPATLPGGA